MDPGIRKTECYSMQRAPLAKEGHGWQSKHLEDIAVEAAECQPATASCLSIWGDRVRPVCHSSQKISQTLLVFTETIRCAKQQQMPRRISSSDLLNMPGP
ncbi:TPA: hypothetical protein ACH3X2_007232 [Trebouxia sp. C0005]